MTETVLSPAVCEEIETWLTRFPPGQRQPALIPALKLVQEEQGGWLSREAICAVAQYLQIPEIAAFEVATFYSMFELAPVGRHKLSFCTSVSCMLCGSDELVDFVKEHLQLEWNETTPDGRFTLKQVPCLAACGQAPVMQVGRTLYRNLTPERLETILASLE